MNPSTGGPAPPTLTERLARLNDNLQTLGERLKASIASAVADAVADAVRDAVGGLLGSKEEAAEPFHDDHSPTHYRYRGEDPWGEEEPRWEQDEGFPPARETPSRHTDTAQRWHSALNAAVQTGVWFLEQQPRRRPVLTTLAVTLSAGVIAFVAGPVFAAGAGVLAAVAGLLLTARASQSAAEMAAG